jgi:hypothetical protein
MKKRDRKRNKPSMRPREAVLRFSVTKNTKLRGVRVNRETGEIRLIGEDGREIPLATAATEQWYDRDNSRKPKKFTFSAPTDPTAAIIDANARLWQFELIFGVDTNTKTIGATKVSVVTVCQCIKGGTEKADIVPLGIIELHGVSEDAERIGWQLACEWLGAAVVPAAATSRVAVVVDSGLQDLPRINARTVPVRSDWVLPEPFTLIYASADSATSSIASVLIADCDRFGTFLLKQLSSSPGQVHLRLAPPGLPFSHFRRWQIREVNGNGELVSVA